MSEAEAIELRRVIAELRHLYGIIWNGHVRHPGKMAEGLLNPQIVRLERLASETEARRAETLGSVVDEGSAPKGDAQ